MTVCVLSQRADLINPTNSPEEVRGIFISDSGNFAASVSDSILTLFDLAGPAISVIGTLDVSEIVDAGGKEFQQTEGTFSQVCFDPAERLMFVSTRDSLLGVFKLEERANTSLIREEVFADDPASLDTALVTSEKSKFIFKLETVLLLPVPECILVPGSRDCLVVAASHKRALFLLDWNNHQSRARRFVYPDLHAAEEEPGSPCVNSVLPCMIEGDICDLPLESDMVVSGSFSSGAHQTLFLGFKSGIVRSFAFSVPSDPMCGLLPARSIACFAAELSKAAFVDSSDPCVVHIYTMDSSVTFSFLADITVGAPVSCLAWSHGHLAVATGTAVYIFNRHQTTYLCSAAIEGCSDMIFSLSSQLIVCICEKSALMQIIHLGVSSDVGSKCTFSQSNNLLMTRNALRLLSPPGRQWRYIPGPQTYMQDNGCLKQAAVQENQSSKFVLVAGKRGFALWSSFSSTSVAKREGRWGVLADKSQEERIGEMDVFGFLSETVFFTKSIESEEIRLWSVLKRIDLSFALSASKLNFSHVDHASGDSKRGILALMSLELQRIDIYQLKADTAKGSYSIELTATLPADFPLPLRALFLVPNGRSCCIVGLSKSSEIFLRTGERVCGNVDTVLSCERFGVERDAQKRSFLPPTLLTEGPSTPSITGIQTPVNELESAESSSQEENDSENDVSVSGEAETFFIGEASCRFCDRLARIPKPKKKIVSLIHRDRPLVFFIDASGSVSVWLLDPVGRLEFATRFASDLNFTEGHQAVSVCPEWGVMSSLNGSDISRVSLSSCVHPLLAMASPEDAHAICTRLSFSPFFSVIIEMWLHEQLTSALPVLSALKAPFDLFSLTRDNPDLCDHPLTRSVLSRLLHAMFIASHFPNVFSSVFAAAVRKSEPHLTFPLATAGAFTGKNSSQLFKLSVEKGRLREAALLLVVIQEAAGPVAVRERFAVPLFREALIVQEYGLAREIAHFHFSFSKKRTLSWSPCSGKSLDDLAHEMLLITIDTVVVSHLNYLVNESLDWFRLVRFAERLRLALGDWLMVVPKHEYLDVSQLVPGFRQMLQTGRIFSQKDEIFDTLLQGFKKAKWMMHWKSLAIAAESLPALRDWFKSLDSAETVTSDAEIQQLIDSYI